MFVKLVPNAELYFIKGEKHDVHIPIKNKDEQAEHYSSHKVERVAA